MQQKLADRGKILRDTRRRVAWAVWLAAALWLAVGWCGVAVCDEAVKREVLPNGMVLVVRQDDFSDLVAIEAMVKVSAFEEPASLPGIRSFLHELMLRASQEGPQALDEWGAETRADVGLDYVSVGALVVSDGFEAAIEALAEALLETEITEARLAALKRRRFDYLQAFENDPSRSIYLLFREALYRNHPYGISTDGTPESIAAMTAADLQAFYDTWYRPNNTVIAVSGNVSPARAKNALERAFGEWEEAPLPARGKVEFVPLQESAVAVRETPSQAATMLLGFAAPPASSKQEFAILRVMSALLSRPMSGRLTDKLRNRLGLAYEISSFYPMLQGESHFAIQVGCRWYQIEETKAAIVEELNRLLRQKVPEAELEATKRWLKGGYVLSLQRNQQRAYNMAWSEVSGKWDNFDKEYIQLIEDTSPEDLRRVGRKYMQEIVIAIGLPE